MKFSHAEQKLDVYDVLMGGKNSWDPAETPFFNRLRKGPDTPNAALCQYPFDAADAPATTGRAQGGEWTQAVTTNRGNEDMLYCRMHYLKEPWGVGEVTQADQGYGTSDEDPAMRQMRLALRAIIKGLDLVAIGNGESQAGSNSAAYQTRGMERILWDTANIANQTDTATIIPAAFRPAAAQVKQVTVSGGDYAFAESDLKAISEAQYTALKAKVKQDVYCTPKFKGKVGDWGNLNPTVTDYTNVRRFNHAAADKTIIATIDTWQGDCAEYRLMLEPFLRYSTSDQKMEAFSVEDRWVTWRTRWAPKAEQVDTRGSGEGGIAYAMMALQVIPQYLFKVYRDS